VLTVVGLFHAVAWGVLIWRAPMMSSRAMGLTMGLSAGLFIAIWAVMMVAMMFPATAPMILLFGTVYASKRVQKQPHVPTWIFVSGYLLVWILPGVVIYFLAVQVENVTGQSMWLMQNSTRISGAILVLAGLYQLSPLKNVCLSKCRTPLQFLLTS